MFMVYKAGPLQRQIKFLITQGSCEVESTWVPALCLAVSVAGLPMTIPGCCFFKCITPVLGKSLVSCYFGGSKYVLFISITIHPLTLTSSQKNLKCFNHIVCFPSRIFPIPVFPLCFYGHIFFSSLFTFLRHKT